jgi:hypothetical protein
MTDGFFMKTYFSKLIQTPWKILIQLASLWISYEAVIDLQSLPANSMKWKAIFYILSSGILLLNGVLFSGLFTRLGGEIRSRIARLPAATKIISVCILNIFPGFFLIYIEWGGYFTGAYFRFVIYLIVSIFTALLVFQSDKKCRNIQVIFLSFGISAFIFSLIVNFSGVRTTPFSLSWSEGNRFYDYSLTFGKNLYTYTGDLHVPYFSPGRYALWGSLFLIPGLPIWVHRLWDAFLWGFMPLLLSGLLTRKIQNTLLKWGVTLWGAMFIMQGPVYPHLLVPMIFLVLILWSDKLWVKLVAGAVISYYAGISRFTWALLPGTWLVLYDLIFEYPNRKGNWFIKLIPTSLLGLAGVLPGVFGSWGSILYPEQSFATTQPLLLYRLLPNATYGEGILLGAGLIITPLIAILAWLIGSTTWKMNKLALASIIVSMSGFLVVGLAASTKIGGGSNLHNLDMFILTLEFVTILAITQLQSKLEPMQILVPTWILILLIIIMIIPGWISYRRGSFTELFNMDLENRSLITIREEVDRAKELGEVLFIDQRQLLTFGYIIDVPLIPEYEKKYMMDQAMGNNKQYFEQFYSDLQNERFKLIISDIQKTTIQKQEEAFSEENNAYVKWVSRHVLEYYVPILTIKKLGIQLLVPK